MLRQGGVDQWLSLLTSQPAADEVPDPEPLSVAQAQERLWLLDVPEIDHDDVLASLPGPGLWPALRRCHQVLFAGTVPDWAVAWPNAPQAHPYFYVHLYLLALPMAMKRQQDLGIPEDVTVATLRDFGAKVDWYRRERGVGGFDRQTWMVRHFRGSLFRLGRLQFDRAVLDSAEYGGTAGLMGGPAAGDPVLEVHIPGDGPMTPDLCEESFRRARPFFERHFPATRYQYATCRSWLLDQQLTRYLPDRSNIVRFQRRFRAFGATPVCDDDVLKFVFGIPPGRGSVDELPQQSTLHRAIVAHLRSGEHWRQGCGWLTLPTSL